MGWEPLCRLIQSPVLLTLGRFGGSGCCPVTEGIGQLEDVKALTSTPGSLGFGKKSRGPPGGRSGAPDFATKLLNSLLALGMLFTFSEFCFLEKYLVRLL